MDRSMNTTDAGCSFGMIDLEKGVFRRGYMENGDMKFREQGSPIPADELKRIRGDGAHGAFLSPVSRPPQKEKPACVNASRWVTRKWIWQSDYDVQIECGNCDLIWNTKIGGTYKQAAKCPYCGVLNILEE